CKLHVAPVDPGANPPRTQADVDHDVMSCARLPARVFFANRAPASMLIGEIGGTGTDTNAPYDPDRFVVSRSVPLSNGPSKLYLASLIDRDGKFSLRVFIVCFDSATIFVYDPAADEIESILHVGTGPFAMAFDPFSLEAVAMR